MKLFQFDPPDIRTSTVSVYGTSHAIDTIIGIAAETEGVKQTLRKTPYALDIQFDAAHIPFQVLTDIRQRTEQALDGCTDIF